MRQVYGPKCRRLPKRGDAPGVILPKIDASHGAGRRQKVAAPADVALR
jgi:hypothetical protein